MKGLRSRKRDQTLIQVYELDKQNKLLKTIVFGFTLVGISVVLFLIISGFQNRLHSPLLWSVLTDVATTIFSLAVTGLLFEYINKENNERQMSGAIVNAILLSNQVLKSLTDESKFSYIHQLLRTMIGDSRGEALYRAYISPFEDRSMKLSFRSSFKYDISFLMPTDEGAPLPQNSTLDSDEYYRVVEILEYEKQFSDLGPIDLKQGFYIVAGLREEDLQAYFTDVNCIYRHVLGLSSQDAKRLQDAMRPLDWVQSFYQVRVLVNGEPVETTMVYEEGVIKTRLLTDTLSVNLEEQDGFHFYINVETVQLRVHNFYTVYLSEPSLAPEVSFHYHAHMHDVHCLSFLSAVDSHDIREWTNETARIVTLKVINRKWVFPTSGLVFVWKDRPFSHGQEPDPRHVHLDTPQSTDSRKTLDSPGSAGSSEAVEAFARSTP